MNIPAHEHPDPDTREAFSTDASILDRSVPSEVVELDDMSRFELRIAPVAKQIGNDRIRMLAYNGSIPGPTLRVRQGTELEVRVRNDADTETTVHWHGLRLDNAYDGVPHETQQPIPVTGEFTYRLRFPDPGLYWYHPHVREDYGLDMGLYGCIVVDPVDHDYWPPVNREEVVTLDDVLIEDGRMAPFRIDGPTHVAMGRFGNVMLTRGENQLRLRARAGEVVRFYLVNTANTRLFNVRIPGCRMKLIGGDSGRYEHETFVGSILLAPSERAIVDVSFESPGVYSLAHDTPEKCAVLGTISIDDGLPAAAATGFRHLRTCPELAARRDLLETDLERSPDKTLAFTSLMPLLYGSAASSAGTWICPMHPNVARSEPATCPHCGMKLVPGSATTSGTNTSDTTTSDTTTSDASGAESHHVHGTGDGLEWEDLMPEINRRSDSSNMIWKLVDVETGATNWEIDWHFRVGDRVKIRLVNDMDQDHPMHHPFHIHGAGRFLVIARDGEPEPNLVWKDTVLVRAGEVVDVVLEVTNPGLWMAHCHIAEHNQSGMMFSFPVTERKGA